MRQYEVIIPVRNGGQSLVNSINSVLSCLNAGRLFLTLSDNFSTDGSLWKKMLENFPTDAWRVISPPEPLGRVEHWSWAFAQARLPWVKLLMAGDRIENAYWDWAETAIAKNPGSGMFFSDAYMIDPQRAHPESAPAAPEQPHEAIYSYEDYLRDAVACRNRIGSLTRVLLRADVLRAALPFEPAFPWTADWRFFKRVLKQTPAVQTSAPLVCLDRSIARFSTSWKGLRTSFAEDWRYAAEQARLTKQPFLKSFFVRLKAVGSRTGLAMGKMILPRPVRRCLTTVTGMHRPSEPQKS
jgi:hypothetical protein